MTCSTTKRSEKRRHVENSTANSATKETTVVGTLMRKKIGFA